MSATIDWVLLYSFKKRSKLQLPLYTFLLLKPLKPLGACEYAMGADLQAFPSALGLETICVRSNLIRNKSNIHPHKVEKASALSRYLSVLGRIIRIFMAISAYFS